MKHYYSASVTVYTVSRRYLLTYLLQQVLLTTMRRETDLVGDNGAVGFWRTVPRHTNGRC